MYEIEVKGGQIVVGDEVLKLCDKFRERELQMQEWKNEEEEFRLALKEAMEKCHLDKWEYVDDSRHIYAKYMPEQIRKTVDTAALKENGLYDAFTKETVVKPTVRLKIE